MLKISGNTRSIIMALSVLFFWTIIGLVGFMLIEGWNFIDSLYMTVITISTVGYGEVAPMSQGGKIFAIVLIIGGWISSFYALARIGQLLFEGGFFDILGTQKRCRKIMELEGHFIVCGYGRIGKGIIEGLRRQKHPFVVVDANHDLSSHFESEGILHVIGDATAEETLKEAGINKAKVLLALLPSDADNLYLTLAAKELNREIYLIARAIYEIAEKRLKSSGADLVISPYKVASAHALHAAMTLNPGLTVDLGTSIGGVPVGLQEFVITANSQLAGVSISASKLKAQYDVLVVGLKRAAGEVLLNPEPNVVMQVGDVLVVAGENANLSRVAAIS